MQSLHGGLLLGFPSADIASRTARDAALDSIGAIGAIEVDADKPGIQPPASWW